MEERNLLLVPGIESQLFGRPAHILELDGMPTEFIAEDVV
jgi:hypothetical protein